MDDCKDECCPEEATERDEEIRPNDGTITYNNLGEAGLSIGRPDCRPGLTIEDGTGDLGVNRGGYRINDLVIKQMDLGYLVKVGCQTLCLETKERLIQLFTAYVNDPKKTIDKYYKDELLNEETKDDE